jgi:predicted SnoaL-like aldol condensation-catalyzing enzyme
MLKKFVWITGLVFALSASAMAQSTHMTSHERANLALVQQWWREVIQAGHLELAPKYMAEDYIQHNPNISTGRAAFVELFGHFVRPHAIEAQLSPAPVIQFAKGDYVVFVWKRHDKDPADPSKTYDYNSFDLIRVQNGKIQEHWDSVAPMPTASPVIPGVGPQPVEPKLTAQEAKNQAIATVEFKDILQYGHIELADKVMAENYIQHNPNVPGGRAAFVNFFSRFLKPEPIKAEWKDKPALILTSGNLVLFLFNRTTKDSADPSKVRKWYWFDMVRVDDGKIQEHWDMAKKNPPRAARPSTT